MAQTKGRDKISFDDVTSILLKDGYLSYFPKNGTEIRHKNGKNTFVFEQKAWKLYDSLNAYLTIPDKDFNTDVDGHEFHSIFKVLRTGAIEGKDDETVAAELADIMKKALFRRGIAFRIIGSTVEAY